MNSFEYISTVWWTAD